MIQMSCGALTITTSLSVSTGFSVSLKKERKTWMPPWLYMDVLMRGRVSTKPKVLLVWSSGKIKRILPKRWIVTEEGRGRYLHHSSSEEDITLRETLNLLQLATQLGKASYASILRLCGNAKALSEGRVVHAHIIKNGQDRDTFLGNLLVQMYGKCGSLEEAHLVFENIHHKNVFSWTIMIGVYIQHGLAEEALELFENMRLQGVKPNKVTFVSILSIYASRASLDEGRGIHALILESACESDVVVGTALVNMYSKCGSLEDARRVFDRMPSRDVVSWNAMIAGYALHQQGKEALQLFQKMQSGGLVPNQVTLLSVLDACGAEADLAEGNRIHSHIVARGFESDVVLGNAVINMYAKCGSLVDARKTFNRMCSRNLVSWTSLIAAYAQHGQEVDALQLFEDMLLEGMIPDNVCFVSVLSACSHVGLVDKGFQYFVSMSRDYDIMPTLEHYNCMIDLIGRAGLLDEGEDLIINMQFEPSAATWTSLLFTYRMHCDVKRARYAAEVLFETEPKHASPYVALSKIYAAAGRWDDAAQVRKTMEDNLIKGLKSHSSVEVNNETEQQFCGGQSLRSMLY